MLHFATFILLGFLDLGPNEFTPSSYAEVLKNSKGTLLGVGTFRVLFDISMGNFDTAIFFDIDPVSIRFSKRNVRMILEAADREDYLRALFAFSETDSRYESLAKDLRDFKKLSPTEFKKTFLGSDEVFRSLRRKLRRTKLQFIVGDLLQKLAWRKQIDVIDISNVMTYFHVNRIFRKLHSALSKIPRSRQTKLLFTYSLPYQGSPTGTLLSVARSIKKGDPHEWIHLSASLETILNALELQLRRGGFGGAREEFHSQAAFALWLSREVEEGRVSVNNSNLTKRCSEMIRSMKPLPNLARARSIHTKKYF